ncbi:nicotinamide mononucleotide transporter [Candidatus Magnetobacterium casense]|uniref:Nicotinamide mononucleotide transporter n=1 Tax=Candidatus Magnetobacterium casense TaxID=1455061 RepID=A0ABS6S2G2_9BACT|nr:nicotinamide mononucleotide transporter [Candidatus Magnetobacterium casensis]
MTFEVITWILAGLAATGTIFCIHRKRTCFFIWMVSDSGWAIVDYSRGIYAQMALYVFFFGLAVWGAWAWKKKNSARW